jgi:hypothetical protein
MITATLPLLLAGGSILLLPLLGLAGQVVMVGPLTGIAAVGCGFAIVPALVLVACLPMQPAAKECLHHRGPHDQSLRLLHFGPTMSERNFQFRLRSSHPAPDRATQDLGVEFLDDSGE